MPNRLVEEHPVSWLYVAQKHQERPYEPLTPFQVQQSIQHNIAYRPPPYVSQDTLCEMYEVFDGHCGIQCADPTRLTLLSMGSRGPGPHSHHSNTVTSNSAGSGEDYRLQMIRQNERHVNSKQKICSFFNTREGCRRGASCGFLHVLKQ